MPREVKAFACEYGCGRKVQTSKKRMVEHEAICFLNPARRACQTCKHFESYNDSEGDHKWIVNACHAKDDEIEERVFDCDLWEPKHNG